MKKSKIKLLMLTIMLGLSAYTYAQEGRVGINTDVPKTTLDVSGKTDTSGNLLTTDMTGLQAPRLTRAELTAKGNALYGAPQTGTLVYITNISGGDATSQRVNITNTGYYYFDGSLWQKVGNGAASNDWTILGNAGTTAGTNFLGTTDDVDLVFKRNNVQSGWLNTSLFNTAFGVSTIPSTTTGTQNTAVGYNGLKANTTGNYNTAVGVNGLVANTTGNNNTSVGANAMLNNVAGSNNTAVGNNAGYSQTTGDNNIMIGTNTEAPNLTGSNQMNIGNIVYGTGMTGSGDGNIGIGNFSSSDLPTTKLDVNGGARIRNLPILLNGTNVVADSNGNLGVYTPPNPDDFTTYKISTNIRQNNNRNVPNTSILDVPKTNEQDGGGSSIQPSSCWVVPNSEVYLSFPKKSDVQRGLASWNLWFEMGYPGGWFPEKEIAKINGESVRLKLPIYFHSRLYARLSKKQSDGSYQVQNTVTVSMKTEQISPYSGESFLYEYNSPNTQYSSPGSANPNYRYFISASYNVESNTINLSEDEEYKVELLYGIENFSSQAIETNTNTSFLQNWGVQSKAESYIKNNVP